MGSCCRKECRKEYESVSKEDRIKMLAIHQKRFDSDRRFPIHPKKQIKTDKDYANIARDWLD